MGQVAAASSAAVCRGQHSGPEEARLKVLQEAFKLDTYVDVELEAMRGFGEGEGLATLKPPWLHEMNST